MKAKRVTGSTHADRERRANRAVHEWMQNYCVTSLGRDEIEALRLVISCEIRLAIEADRRARKARV